MSRNQVQPCTGFGAADVVGALVVGAAVVVGAFVVGATVVGAFVVGAAAFVVGAAVAAGLVVGAAAFVVGAAVAAGFVVGAAALLGAGAVVLLVVAGATGIVEVATAAPPDADRVGVLVFRPAVVAPALVETACAATVPAATAPPPASETAADADTDGVVLAEALGGFTVATSSAGAGGAATATAGDAEVQEPAGVYAVFRALPQPVMTAQPSPTASRPAPTRSGRWPAVRVIERIVIGPAPPGIVAAELPRRCTDRVAASG